MEISLVFGRFGFGSCAEEHYKSSGIHPPFRKREMLQFPPELRLLFFSLPDDSSVVYVASLRTSCGY